MDRLPKKEQQRGILLWEAELLDDKGDWKVMLPCLPGFRGFQAPAGAFVSHLQWELLAWQLAGGS